jgi:hypothetical protein
MLDATQFAPTVVPLVISGLKMVHALVKKRFVLVTARNGKNKLVITCEDNTSKP